MNKKAVLSQLADYFIIKGAVLDKREYMKQEDYPIRPVLVGRCINSWSRLEEMIKRNFPEKYALIGAPPVKKEVVKNAKPSIQPKV